MLRVAEHAESTDTGRHRRTNEDAYVARAPLFVVADGMGGAQAGEVASRTAVEVLGRGLPAGAGSVEERLCDAVQAANERIHQLSVADEGYAGMGTTLTAAHVGDHEVTVVHVGDSRCYRLRGGRLEQLTVDHTLVEELVRQGRLAPEEVGDHPQRSIVTRVLGPEALVRVDTHTFPARSGDLFLLCSDGLTTMVGETEVAAELAGGGDLRTSARRLVQLANDAGGRDNITVVLFRLEELDVAGADEATRAGANALRADEVRRAVADAEATREVARPEPSRPGAAGAPLGDAGRSAAVPRPAPAAPPPARRRRRVPGGLIAALVIGAIVIAGGYLATQAVYFVGTDDDGFVTVYRGVPYDVLGLDLYQEVYVSGVSAAQLAERQRTAVAGHKLRSREDADDLVRQFELGRAGG
jgi:protein phosphatase